MGWGASVDEIAQWAETAIRLQSELGEDAMTFVSSRMEEARKTGDQDQVQHWRDVAHTLLTLAEESGPDGDHGRLWT
jgi:hypothetical protein